LSMHATSTPRAVPLSLHDALPISHQQAVDQAGHGRLVALAGAGQAVHLNGGGEHAAERDQLLLGTGHAAAPLRGYQGSACSMTPDRKSTRLNSSHVKISYAVFCLK